VEEDSPEAVCEVVEYSPAVAECEAAEEVSLVAEEDADKV
jgi:hypothetical protein